MSRRRKIQRRPGQPGGQRDLNRKAKEQRIQDSALALFLSRGLDAVAIDDITQSAGIPKGSFYRYFTDKTNLVEALMVPPRVAMEGGIGRCAKLLETASDGDSMLRAYREIGQALAVLVMEHPSAIRLYLQESRGPRVGARTPIRALSDWVSKRAMEITEIPHRRRLFRPVHHAVSALTVVGASERLLLAVLQEEDLGNVLEVPEAVVRLILDGLRS